jgi:hypothetical protein
VCARVFREQRTSAPLRRRGRRPPSTRPLRGQCLGALQGSAPFPPLRGKPSLSPSRGGRPTFIIDRRRTGRSRAERGANASGRFAASPSESYASTGATRACRAMNERSTCRSSPHSPARNSTLCSPKPESPSTFSTTAFSQRAASSPRRGSGHAIRMSDPSKRRNAGLSVWPSSPASSTRRPGAVPWPRALDYARGLPDGLRSYPDVEIKASLFEQALADKPLGDAAHALPAEVASLVAPRHSVSAWVPSVPVQALYLAIADHYGFSDDAFEECSYATQKALLGTMYRTIAAVASPGMLLAGGALRWRSLHRGTKLRTSAAGARTKSYSPLRSRQAFTRRRI